MGHSTTDAGSWYTEFTQKLEWFDRRRCDAPVQCELQQFSSGESRKLRAAALLMKEEALDEIVRNHRREITEYDGVESL